MTSRTSDLPAAAQYTWRKTAEASKIKTIYGAQIVTPFGGYIHEDDDAGAAPEEPRKRLGARLAVVLTVTPCGATTGAAAISASSRNRVSVPKLWLQNPPSILMKLPGSFVPDEALF